MAEMMFWGFAVRFLTSLVQASPFILVGFAVAAILRRFFGPAETRRLFGEGTRSALFRAWVIGMLLPVCSLGAIPVIREMRRAGIRGGTILAFAMSGPLFNPLSLLYGLTLSEPIAILSFAACSLVIVTVVGLVWDRMFPDSALPPADERAVAYGYRRMLAVGTAGGREAASASLLYILLGLAGAGLLGAIIPANSLQHTFNYDNPLAPLYMTGMAIPVYATPMLAMSQLGMMFQHANSVGAAFVLLVLGAGMNIGIVAWLYREYGFKRGTTWMVLLLSVVLALAYGVDQPLFPKDIEPANHTHAFDIYCQPFSGTLNTSYFEATKHKLQRDISPFEWRPLWIFGLLIFSGVVLKMADRSSKLESWLEAAPPKQISGRIDIIVPGPILGLLSLAGLFAISIVGCFAYYPAPDECLEAMTDTRVGALSAALAMDHMETKYWAERYDEWTRKLEAGAWLRHRELSDYHRWKARLLREQLEILEHEVEDREREEVVQLVSRIYRTHVRLRRAYTEEF
ncbi:MAG: hypothetical protein DWI29_04580 [Planctomycetota bacterium]|nr:MAG: hypothetical protein DWI29_04580 [Planctomycetota bacterium]